MKKSPVHRTTLDILVLGVAGDVVQPLGRQSPGEKIGILL